MRLADYTLKLLGVSETLRRWQHVLAALDERRRGKVARFADQIADTLARAAEAFERVDRDPADRRARHNAVRELGRLSGYIESIVDVLEGRIDGRRLRGIRRRLEGLERDGRIAEAVRRAGTARIERLVASEGYFRALADALRA